MSIFRRASCAALAAAAALVCAAPASAAEPLPAPAPLVSFSATEVQLQVGRLVNPFNRTRSWTPIVTIQHVSAWPFGDIFAYVDLLDDRRSDATNFNDKDAYGEAYAYFSAAKLLGVKFGGPLADVGAVAAVNAGADANYLSYLPGAYADWTVPGFLLFRTQLTAVIDDSRFPSRQRDGWQFDWSFAAPFEIRGQLFSFEGHVEYTANSRNRSFGVKQKDWILGQPQLRWDAGHALTGKKDVFFLGAEYQFWINSLGTNTDESSFQALAVLRF